MGRRAPNKDEIEETLIEILQESGVTPTPLLLERLEELIVKILTKDRMTNQARVIQEVVSRFIGETR